MIRPAVVVYPRIDLDLDLDLDGSGFGLGSGHHLVVYLVCSSLITMVYGSNQSRTWTSYAPP